MNYPLNKEIVKPIIDKLALPDFSRATIREIVGLAKTIQAETGVEFARMEMGIPGTPAAEIGVKAEIAALERGVASAYPTLEGEKCLKDEASRFIKAFIDLDVPAECCVPAVGSMNGVYATFLVCGQCDKAKDTVLFIDPGFPVQKMQLQVLGYKSDSFDVYDYRGDKLHDKLESYLKKGNIAAIIYSNPNNPSWVCLRENELEIIGKLATQYDTIVMEDLAYFAMDFRKDLGTPFKAPFQPTVGKYTDNYILMISASKVFSYAGQRMGLVAMSPSVYSRKYPALKERYGVDEFGNVLISRVLYSLSSGVSHSTQYAMAAMMKAASDGEFKFLDCVKSYGEKATVMKKFFLDNGFHIVYDKDLDEEIADGFYFTVGYKNLTGAELMYEFLFYGMSAIALNTTGSHQQGLRICTSFIKESMFDDIRERIEAFNANH